MREFEGKQREGVESDILTNVIYGLTIRGNLTVPEVKRDVSKAIDLAVEHLEKYL